MHRAHLIRLLVALAGAAAFAQGALAWGEPKNEPPFTRQVPQQRSAAAATHSATIAAQGEPKNEPPFTRPVTP
jgi:hypothetical protein